MGSGCGGMFMTFDALMGDGVLAAFAGSGTH